MNRIDRARSIFIEVGGNKPAFISAMVSSTGMDQARARVYYNRVRVETTAALHAQRRAGEPITRKVVVVLEMELEEHEDSYQTAELMLEIASSRMDNQMAIISVGDKIN